MTSNPASSITRKIRFCCCAGTGVRRSASACGVRVVLHPGNKDNNMIKNNKRIMALYINVLTAEYTEACGGEFCAFCGSSSTLSAQAQAIVLPAAKLENTLNVLAQNIGLKVNLGADLKFRHVCFLYRVRDDVDDKSRIGQFRHCE